MPRRLVRIAFGIAVVAGGLVGWQPVHAGQIAHAKQTWAPASSATIHPGVETFTNGAQCTANFIFSDGTNVYIGQAAHCASTGGNSQTDGCTTPVLRIGTPVVVQGASKPGVLVYDSWHTMQASHEKDANACAFNDLALVKLNPLDVAKVNPSLPFWGGPVALNTTGTTAGENVYSYGNSVLRLEVTALSPKQGTSQGDQGHGWSHQVMTINPGIPGDSGSGFLDQRGNAIGDLSTIDITVSLPTGTGVTNSVSDLSHELLYLAQHAGPAFANVALVPGTVPFKANQIPVDVTHRVGDPAFGIENFFGI